MENKKRAPSTACVECGGRRFTMAEREEIFQVNALTLKVSIPARECVKCGEGYTRYRDLRRAHLVAAAELARGGPMSGAGFKFMREATEMTATGLGELLDVSLGTISRWEHGARNADRGAWVTLGAIVLDRLAGLETTIERLRALQKSRATKVVRLEASDRMTE